MIGKQIAIMFIIMLLGGFCGYKGVISRTGLKQLSTVELHIVNPLLIFMSYQTELNSRLLGGLAWAFALSALSFAAAIVFTTLVIPRKRKDFDIERFASVYSNCGFIGIPLINGIYGQEGVLYLTAYITLFNLLVWTHGYMVMKGEKDFSAFLSALKNPSVIAVILGLIFYLTNIRLPEIPASSLELVSSMNTPLAMLIAGATASQTNFLKAMKNSGIYIVSGLKLIAVPALCYGLMCLTHAPELVVMTLTIAAGCPVATTGTMFAVLFDKKPERCSEFFAVTTVLSGITLPLLTAVCVKLF